MHWFSPPLSVRSHLMTTMCFCHFFCCHVSTLILVIMQPIFDDIEISCHCRGNDPWRYFKQVVILKLQQSRNFWTSCRIKRQCRPSRSIVADSIPYLKINNSRIKTRFSLGNEFQTIDLVVIPLFKFWIKSFSSLMCHWWGHHIPLITQTRPETSPLGQVINEQLVVELKLKTIRRVFFYSNK